jgi:CHAT domain-containing protein/tetratricopeptide (TPR) repeat protein
MAPSPYWPSHQKNARLADLIEQLRRLPRNPITIPVRIQLCQQALKQVRREEQPKLWAQLHSEMGLCLKQAPTGGPGDNMERAISHYEQALKEYTPSAYFDEWVATMHNLAVIYTRRIRGDWAENQEKAIDLHKRVLQVCTPQISPAAWALSHCDLGRLYAKRIEEDQAANLEAAIDHCQQALKVWTRDGHPVRWAKVQDLLGTLYRCRLLSDPAENLEESLCYHQAALEQLEPRKRTHAKDWARVHHNLGTALFHRIRGNRRDNLEKAITHFEKALNVRIRDTLEWAATQHNLAAAYIERQQEGRAENIERAIEFLEAVLRVRQQEKFPVEWAMTQNVLGIAHLKRIHGERAENLERAIDYFEAALQEQERVGPAEEKASTQHNLAIAYSERLLGDRIKNLEMAAKFGKAALETLDKRALIKWATIKTDMVDILWKLANLERHRDRGQAAATMEEAIVHGKEVVSAFEGQPPSHRQALAYYNLGNAYGDRMRGNRADNQEKAIEHYKRALDFYTIQNFPGRWANTHNNLGVTYWERVRGNRRKNLEKAIWHFNTALKVFESDTFPVDARRAARNLGNLFFGEGRWTEAHAAYTTALQAAEALYTAAFMEAGREAEISENATLYARDAFCLAHLGQIQEALVRLEEGKTRTLAERLGRDTVQLEKAKPEDQKAYRELVNHLKVLEVEQRARGNGRPYTEIAKDVEQARKELDTLTQRIHGYLPDFLPAPLDFAAIQALVPDEQTALVELCVTEKGTVVLVVRREAEPQAVWVEGFTQGELQHLLLKRGERGNPTNGWLVTYWQYQQAVETYAHAKRKADQQPTSANLLALETARVACDQAWAAWHAATDRITAEIGRRLVAPLHTALHGFNITRLVLIPQGSLFLVPLHATLIGKDGLRLLDRYGVSYTPSAAVLQRCQERAAQARGQGLLAVINPQKDPRLVFTFVEGERIASLFSKDQLVLLEEYKGTKKAVLQNAQGRGYLHFSCHGIYNWSDPLKSGLFLTDPDRLTLEDLQRPYLEFEDEGEKERVEIDMTAAHLVTLSACETGITEATTSRADEYVGLPAGFMLAGVPCVVSSLWSVPDLSTALLMERFYRNHLGDPDEDATIKPHLPPAEALRQAQIWLRDEVTAQEAAKRCDKQIDRLESKGEDAPAWLSRAWREYAQMARKTPDSRPFAHPFHWAAFAIYGATQDPEQAKGTDSYA